MEKIIDLDALGKQAMAPSTNSGQAITPLTINNQPYLPYQPLIDFVAQTLHPNLDPSQIDTPHYAKPNLYATLTIKYTIVYYF